MYLTQSIASNYKHALLCGVRGEAASIFENSSDRYRVIESDPTVAIPHGSPL